MEEIKAEDLGDHVDTGNLVKYLLGEPWHRDCTVIPDYMPPYPGEKTRPTLQVRFSFGPGDDSVFLRYSHGPKQGFFWDVYGDDFKSAELALLALSRAPTPQRACMTFNLPLADVEKKPEEA